MLNRGSGGILCCVDFRALHPLRVPLLGLPARPSGQCSVAPVPLVSVLCDVQSQPSLQCMELNRLGTVLPSEPTVEGTTQNFLVWRANRLTFARLRFYMASFSYANGDEPGEFSEGLFICSLAGRLKTQVAAAFGPSRRMMAHG